MQSLRIAYISVFGCGIGKYDIRFTVYGIIYYFRIGVSYRPISIAIRMKTVTVPQ